MIESPGAPTRESVLTDTPSGIDDAWKAARNAGSPSAPEYPPEVDVAHAVVETGPPHGISPPAAAMAEGGEDVIVGAATERTPHFSRELVTPSGAAAEVAEP